MFEPLVVKFLHQIEGRHCGYENGMLEPLVAKFLHQIEYIGIQYFEKQKFEALEKYLMQQREALTKRCGKGRRALEGYAGYAVYNRGNYWPQKGY